MLEPVIKEVWVPEAPEDAFRRFTDGIQGWWPLTSHSVSMAECQAVRFRENRQRRAKGAQPVRTLVEEDLEGREHLWGTVYNWEPPHGVVLSWHPGRGPDEAQEIEVTFQAARGGTTVRLTHRQWEALGERAEQVRSRYDAGWLDVLELFVTKRGV